MNHLNFFETRRTLSYRIIILRCTEETKAASKEIQSVLIFRGSAATLIREITSQDYDVSKCVVLSIIS